MDSLTMRPVARVRTGFESKFGVPRQSGLVPGLRGQVVFEPEFRSPEALRGLEGFSHLWLLWGFSQNRRTGWSPTVRPPRLGGNRRLGVFATRSPFRPNPIGLSCVRLERIELGTPQGPVLHILGADLLDGTPVYDIKPYLPSSDCVPEALGGFTDETPRPVLAVDCPPELLEKVPAKDRETLLGVLALDPRPAYQHDAERIYGFGFEGLEVRFSVDGERLRVREIEKK